METSHFGVYIVQLFYRYCFSQCRLLEFTVSCLFRGGTVIGILWATQTSVEKYFFSIKSLGHFLFHFPEIRYVFCYRVDWRKKKSGNSALAPNTVLDIMTHTSYEMVLYILFIPLAGVCVLTIHKTCRLEKYTKIRLITDIDASHRGDVLYLYTRYVIGFVFLKRYFYIRSVSLN